MEGDAPPPKPDLIGLSESEQRTLHMIVRQAVGKHLPDDLDATEAKALSEEIGRHALAIAGARAMDSRGMVSAAAWRRDAYWRAQIGEFLALVFVAARTKNLSRQALVDGFLLEIPTSSTSIRASVKYLHQVALEWRPRERSAEDIEWDLPVLSERYPVRPLAEHEEAILPVVDALVRSKLSAAEGAAVLDLFSRVRARVDGSLAQLHKRLFEERQQALGYDPDGQPSKRSG